MCLNENIQLPQKYTRRKSFYDDVKEILGERAGFVPPIDPKAHLLIYPSCESDFAIAQHLASVIQVGEGILDDTDETDARTGSHSPAHKE